MARENLFQQISALTRTYRLLLAEGDITRPQLKAKLIAAQAVMEDGTEINSLGFEGGNTAGIVMYPKEVILESILTILAETAPGGNPFGNANSDVVTMDFSQTRIQT